MSIERRFHGRNIRNSLSDSQINREEPENMLNEQRWNRFNVFENQRQNFSRNVYLIATIFIFLTFMQWVVISLNETLVEFFKHNSFVTYTSLFLAIVLLSIFFYMDVVRYSPAYNWIFAIVIVELETCGFVWGLLDIGLFRLAMCFIVTGAIVVGFTLIGFVLPRDLTPNIVELTITDLIFYFLAGALCMVAIFTRVSVIDYVLIGIMVVLISVHIMFNAQLILGTRSIRFHLNDFMVPALITHLSFTVIFILSAYVANRL